MSDKISKGGFGRELTEQIKKDKAAFAVYMFLRLCVIGVMIRSAFIQRWESVFTCFLCLLLFLVLLFLY